MSDLIIEKKNESYIILKGEEHIIQELYDTFSFYADGYKYHPSYKRRLWDGVIRLVKRKTKNIAETYSGLIHEIVRLCQNRNYSVTLFKQNEKIPTDELNDYINSLQLTAKGTSITPRDYQIKGFVDAIQYQKILLQSCTSSGKSLIIYCIMRYLIDQGMKGLLIVPNVSLIHQLFNDFDDYSSMNGWNVTDYVHKIYSGQDKHSDKQVYLSTWQSLMALKKSDKILNKKYFDQFDFVMVDEAHFAKGVELSDILEKCVNAKYRIGLTGTTGTCKANIKTIVGLTGFVNQLNTTRELIDKKEVANFSVKCLVLNHPEETKQLLKKYKYHEEVRYLISDMQRNQFIKNLAISMKSNSLLLFNFIEHGKLLYEMISKSKYIGDRNVYLIYGEIDGAERERIRNVIESEQNAIIIASVQTTGTGVSIKNLHNIVFCSGTKSSIRLLQSIGRAIRLHESKEKAVIYDIVDDLSWKGHKNFSLLHFLERVKIYNEQQFDYKLIKVKLDN